MKQKTKDEIEKEGSSEWIDLNRKVPDSDAPQQQPPENVKTENAQSPPPVEKKEEQALPVASEKSDEEMDFRIERLMPDAKVEPLAYSDEVSQKKKRKEGEIKPWEIDVYGNPLKEKPKVQTAYEKWVSDKRDEFGIIVKCPNCGSTNNDLAFITGEKCKDCGYDLDEFENVEDKMGQYDKATGQAGIKGYSAKLATSLLGLESSLAIPNFMLEKKIQPFEFVFATSSHITNLIYTLIYLVAFAVFAPSLLANGLGFVDVILLAIIIGIGYVVFNGLVTASRVTSIKVDEYEVTFRGMAGTTRMLYENIFRITNKREIRGLAAGRGSESSINRFIGFYFFGILGYFLAGAMNDDPVPEMDTDSSSTSYMNHITISTPVNFVNYSFVGGGNLEFIRALAIIIYMAKKKNPECYVDPRAIKAAEKGTEHYAEWQKRH